jgi:2-dehydro-3-deoxyphosphogluconate aldolase/(4S)-4-hydroxy-2-oxoglutarate aldolase
MNKTEVLQKIETGRLVPVIRTSNAADAETLVRAIFAGGVRLFEITLSVPDAPRVIESLTEEFSGGALVGAGTVLSAKDAEICIASGAKFIVSPIFDRGIINVCRARGVAVFPGALTPNEIFTAAASGADAVKVFPASATGGASYLKALRAVFPEIKLMPTGGVNLETVADFFRAGAFAVGVGGELADMRILREQGEEEITRRAREFVEKIGAV